MQIFITLVFKFFSKLFKFLPWVLLLAFIGSIAYFVFDYRKVKRENEEWVVVANMAAVKLVDQAKQIDSLKAVTVNQKEVIDKSKADYQRALIERDKQRAAIRNFARTATPKQINDTLTAIASRNLTGDAKKPLGYIVTDTLGKDSVAAYTKAQQEQILWDVLEGQVDAKQAEVTATAKATYDALISGAEAKINKEVEATLKEKHFLGIGWRKGVTNLGGRISKVINSTPK